MLALAGMMLVLSLCFVGCGTYRSPNWIEPAVNVGPNGNAVITTLPMGTVICVPDKEAGEKIGMAFVNELVPATTDWVGGKAFRCKVAVKICTQAYIAQRDARELRSLTTDSAESTDGKKAGPHITEDREGRKAWTNAATPILTSDDGNTNALTIAEYLDCVKRVRGVDAGAASRPVAARPVPPPSEVRK